MKRIQSQQKRISFFVTIAFTAMLFFWANQAPAAPTAPAANEGPGATLESSSGESTGFIEQEETAPVVKKGKKFPWVIVALAVVAGGAAVYFLVLKKKNYTLQVTVGEGVTGTPVSGTGSHKKGTVLSYNYALQSGYGNLVVTLDGAAVPASGSVTMNDNHTLEARASRTFALNVAVGTGVNGTPAAGTTTYTQGTVVNYSYALKSGYSDLSVTLDGAAVAASGTVTMDGNHNLAASASKAYTLTVSKGSHVIGTPNSGTFTYASGTAVNYNYAPASGYSNLVVKVDNVVAASSGTIAMTANHTLTVSASAGYTLAVTRGAHVEGTPASGSYTYASGTPVAYDYEPASGYSGLVVKLDGVTVASSGTVTMNASHTLVASLGGGTLVVNSNPSGARIYLDKVDSGFTTPHTFSFPADVMMNVRLRASSCGYREYFATVPVHVGSTATVNANLVPGIGEDFGIPASSCWNPYYSINWTVIGGHYRYVGSPAGGSPNAYLKSFSGDYTVVSEMNRMQGLSSSANALFLGTNTSTTAAYGYFFAYYTNGTYGIWRFSSWNFLTWAGTFTPIKSGASAAIHAGLNKWNTMKIVKAGNHYTFYINNTSLHSFTDAAYNPTYLQLVFHSGGTATDTRTDLVDLIPST